MPIPPLPNCRCINARSFVAAALLVALLGTPTSADELGVGATAGRWATHPALQQFDLAGKNLSPRLFLVRTRGELPGVDGVKVHGANGGIYLVSGDASAIEDLAASGCAVIPLQSGTPRRTSAPREWKRVEEPDPAIAEMVSQVTWEELREKIQWLVDFGTRMSYAPNHREVATSIKDKLASHGLESRLIRLPYGRGGMWNVEAVQTGTVHPDRCVIICGHFDSISDSPTVAPGADDNATGTAAVLTAAEILSRYEFEYSIRYLCFAGEEQFLLGSKHYAEWARQENLDIVGALNFDMLGYWEPGVPKDLEIETNEASQWFAAAITNAADLYTDAPYELHVYDGAWWGDHASFWDQGYAAVNHEESWDWGDPDFNPHYHTTDDLVENLDPDFTTDNTQVAVAALATLARPVQPIEVAFDLRPGSCVNPFNPKSQGVVPALVLGSDELDVRDIDVASLRVADSIVPTKIRVADMASASDDPCSDMAGDGIVDLSMKLPAAEIAAVIGPAAKHESMKLRLTGNLKDGTRIAGEDVVAIVGNTTGGPQLAPERSIYTTSLGAAVPNPFNPVTSIAFTLAYEDHVTLAVYDVRGKLVARLVDGIRPAGEHAITWSAGDQPSGVYFYRLQTSDHMETRKLVLLK